VTDLASYLPGTWRVDRALEDAALGAGRFHGSATFTRDGDGLAWVESGHMTLGRYDGPARRTLRIVPDGHGWAVEFADGRPFHRLELAHGDHCTFEHPCGADRYAGELAVRGPDAFEIGWEVSGPAKAQRLTGRYVRDSLRASSCSRKPAASST
jgi:hypothetical protein